MKLLTLVLFTAHLVNAQQTYYNDVDLTLTGQDLYFELQSKISNASSSFTYGDVKESVKVTDEDPNNANNVLLVYGYNDADGNCTTDRSRNKNDFGGTSCEYNREHVFARSLANPSMGSADNNTTGIAADPHNLRPSDQQMNGNKGNKKLAAGSGNAGNVGSGNWYPGDEWKGDVARMMMYMYTRYGDRCLPSLIGVGSTQGSTDMLQLFLQWNVEDPVSNFEDQRNPHLETVYGNRNPFIDNPYLATIIWGGPAAEDRWDMLNTSTFSETISFSVYPNPSNSVIQVSTSQDIENITYSLYTIQGKHIATKTEVNASFNVAALPAGMYLLKAESNNSIQTKKIIKY